MTDNGRRFNDAVTRFWTWAAPHYDLPFLQESVYRPPQDAVIAQLRLHGARRIADIACGTGILAARIQQELDSDEVHGVDMSDGMLEQAQARSSAVHWHKAPAERLPLADGSLDAVVSTSAFHFFDQPAAMREFHRVLNPGGLVAVATISPPLPKLLRTMTGPTSPAHNPSPDEMRTLFTEAGLRVIGQRRPDRPLWTRAVWDLITVGIKA